MATRGRCNREQKKEDAIPPRPEETGVPAKFAEEAENMEIRAELMRSIQNRIRNKDWTQSQAAKRFGVTQPRISDLMCGKIEKFTIDTLVNMVAAGLHIHMNVTERASMLNNRLHSPSF